MKILQLGKFYPIAGGVEKVMYDFTRGISERGIDCDMLCAILPEDGPEQTLILNGHGRVICVPAITKKAATMLSPAMVKWLRRHKDEYDIIHVHHPDPMACLALRLSGFKGRVVLHWHSDILKQKFILTFYRPLQNWLIRRADKIVGTTPVYVKESPDLQKVQDKVTYVPIGIDPVEFDPEKAAEVKAAYPGKKIIFSLGRLVEYKGFTYLVDAAKYLPDDYVVLIGGKGVLDEQLRSQILSEGLSDKVRMLGYMTDDQVHNMYGACDVYVMSSVLKTEAFGIVQIEAMSCGKPVVATKVPHSGVSWVNEDGVSGLNVPIMDPEALAEAIKKITINCDKYDTFARGSLERYQKMFNFARSIDSVLRVYSNFN